ncbi:MAG TPA: hypothetical protein VK697_08025 [Methylomirabilota bacterium]|nr:hypothetical protein [Methylomirabilota bacterium]
MPARHNRGNGGIAAIGALIGVAAATALAIGVSRPGPGPGPSAPPAIATATTTGPVVFYEVLDADGSQVVARSLDGRSLARVIARRPNLDYARTWTVDPSGRVAIAHFDGSDGSRLEAIDTVTGASRWIVDSPAVDLGFGAWSADGTRFAATTQPEDATKRQAVIVDVASGALINIPIPPDPGIQGFDADGALVLRERLTDAMQQTRGWRFLRVDPATSKIEQLSVPPAIGPSTTGGDDVDPATGVGLDLAPREDGTGTDVRRWSLAGGGPRTMATFGSVDTIALDPAGRLVAIGVGDTSVVVAGLDGRSSPIWTGKGRGDLAWSADGDYLGVNSWDRVSRIDVVERASARVVHLPIPSGIAQATLVRIVGGVALPQAALPASEPTPTPTPGPSGPDLAATSAVIAGWIDQTGPHAIAHVERLIPTQGGGLRSTSAMEPADVGVTPAPASGDVGGDGLLLSLLPRPGSPDVLVWVDTPEGSRAWLWEPGGTRRDLTLPAGWPSRTSDVSWRPDGLGLAATAYETGADGATRAGFVIGTIGGDTRRVGLPSDYDRLEGWWSQDELLVGHAICTEGCPGRYSYSARLDLANGKLRQFSSKDHGRLPIHYWSIDDSGRTILLSAVNEDTSNDIRIDWPASIPIEGGLDVVGWSSDARSLFVTARTAAGPAIYRIDDPIGRARAGHLTDPAPVLIGGMPAGDVSVSPDGQWAVTSDRTGASRLVELASGRVWPIDSAATIVWPDGD